MVPWELQSKSMGAEMLVMGKPILLSNICVYRPTLSPWPRVTSSCKESWSVSWSCPAVCYSWSSAPGSCSLQKSLLTCICRAVRSPLRCGKDSMCHWDGVSLPLVMRNLSGISSPALLRLSELWDFLPSPWDSSCSHWGKHPSPPGAVALP